MQNSVNLIPVLIHSILKNPDKINFYKIEEIRTWIESVKYWFASFYYFYPVHPEDSNEIIKNRFA